MIMVKAAEQNSHFESLNREQMDSRMMLTSDSSIHILTNELRAQDWRSVAEKDSEKFD